MSSKNENIRIEKYDIEAFKKEQKPYAQILNEVIQKCPIKHANEFLLWCFLESLPPTWKPNKHHLIDHFQISERTYERYMGWLNTVGLIEYRQERKKDGSFGKWELIVLNGTAFNPEAISKRSAKIGGKDLSRIKKGKVIPNSCSTVSAKNGGTDEIATSPASIGEQTISPFRQKTVERLNDGHINTTMKNKKERKKTNSPVSVFSNSLSVKNHVEMVIANRKVYVDDEIIDQGIYYAYETNNDKSFDSVNKRINIFLKKVREDKWLIPQGYNGITSQSIREEEENHYINKQEEYKKDKIVMQNLGETLKKNGGFQEFRQAMKNLNVIKNDNRPVQEKAV